MTGSTSATAGKKRQIGAGGFMKPIHWIRLDKRKRKTTKVDYGLGVTASESSGIDSSAAACWICSC